VQDFSSRYPLLAGMRSSVQWIMIHRQMRYTETRLAAISHEAMLAEIGEETVEFIGNFDNSQEPTVCCQPSCCRCCSMAALELGMATNIPPHNWGSGRWSDYLN